MRSVWEEGWGFQNVRIYLFCTLCKFLLAFVIKVQGYKIVLKKNFFLVDGSRKGDKKENLIKM